MLQVYDRVLTSRSIETLIYLTLIVAAALALYGLGEMFRGRIAIRLSNLYMLEYAEDVFDYLIHDRNSPKDPGKILQEINTVRGFLAGRQFINLFDLPFFPLFLLLMFLLHVTLGLVTILGIIAMICVAVLNNRLTSASRENSATTKSEASSFSLAVMRRTDDVRAMGLLPAVLARWGQKTATSLNSADDAAQYSSAFFGGSKFVRQALQIFTMAWGAYLVLQGDMSGGMIFAATMLLGKALLPIEQLIGGWEATVNAWKAHKSIQEITGLAREKPHLTALPAPRGIISVENIVFNPGADSGAAPILDDVSFTFKPGEIVAFMGPSGAGKSTLAKIIVGALAPTSGVVRLDNFDIEQWPQAQRGGAIGYVPQDIMLFPGTIAENIARLEVDPEDEIIVRAATLAGVHEMIAALPDGYATMVGPNSVLLSGGQRQRIALARAFYTSPRVLILDEPNAHLDSQGEEQLMTSLTAAKNAGVAVMIVSQRRSILQIADRILLVEGGKIKPLNRSTTGLQKPAKPKTPAPAFHPNKINPQMPEALVERLRSIKAQTIEPANRKVIK